MSDKIIEFMFEGRKYQVELDPEESYTIVLPDKRTLEVNKWSESDPPEILDFSVVNHSHMDFPLVEIANLTEGVLAEIIEEEVNPENSQNDVCPCGHTYGQHYPFSEDNFCIMDGCDCPRFGEPITNF